MAASKRTAKKPKTTASKKAAKKPPAKKASKQKAPAKKSAPKLATKPAAKKAPAKLAKATAKKSAPKLATKPAAKKAAAKPAKPTAKSKAPIKKAPVEKTKPSVAAEPVIELANKSDSITPARDARQLLEQRKAIKTALAPVGDGKTIVDSYMRDVDHPFKAEMEAVRQIILGVSPKLSERIKWNAPSFYYKEDLGAFNPRATEFAHLILLFPGGGALPEKSPILEGTHKDRREVKFHGMDDVKSKQRALEKIIKDWVALRDS